MPGTPRQFAITTAAGSDQRQTEITVNQSILDLQQVGYTWWGDAVLSWSSGISASGLALGRGSTDTNIGSGAFRFTITGQAASEAKAAVAAGTAIGAQTVPADTWAAYSLDVATGGTITVSPAAANATTGYATEALAIAAVPQRVTAKARLGYITVKTKAATAWIAATDALFGGASGNVASATNYYPFMGQYAPTGTPTNCLLSGASASLWTAGANGVVIPTVLSRGSTDTNLANTAFTFNAGNGVANIAKAAVAAGTAFGALGTIPINTWGVIAVFIDVAGAITFVSGPDNYGGGYGDEASAQRALAQMTPGANKAYMGYVTVKTKAGTTFVVGTDALAGGATGNVASATNYYPTPGFTPVAGIAAIALAGRAGALLTQANL